MKLNKLFFVPLCAMLLTGCNTGGGSGKGGGGGGKKTTNPSASEVYPEVEIKTGDHGYYNVDEYRLNDYSKKNLVKELHRLMLDTHTKQVRYAQFSNYIKQTTTQPHSIDQVDANTNKNEFFYTGKQTAFSTSMTREHVWPCAKSGGMWVHSNYSDEKYHVDNTNYVGGGSDLYHVRPCTSSVNTARGDSRFIEFKEEEKANLINATDGGEYSLLCDSTTFSQYSEPADEFKGDVARIIAYVYVHFARIDTYGLEAWGDYLGNFAIKDVIGRPTDSEYEVYDQLIRWNEIDPPSETEKLRNDTVQPIQGNRNPFVDYPHLMRKCFSLE